MESFYFLEPGKTMPVIEDYQMEPRQYALRRRDSYDGLGLLISADVDTRMQHCIRDVEPNSPGYHAGLRPNDRIIAVNGINVENIEFGDVLVLIKQGLKEDNLRLTVINESKLI